MLVSEMSLEELKKWIEIYEQRIADSKIGKYHCECDNFDTELMETRYKMLLEEYEKKDIATYLGKYLTNMMKGSKHNLRHCELAYEAIAVTRDTLKHVQQTEIIGRCIEILDAHAEFWGDLIED